MRSRLLQVLVMVSVGALVAAACGGDGDDAPPVDVDPQAQTASDTDGDTTADTRGDTEDDAASDADTGVEDAADEVEPDAEAPAEPEPEVVTTYVVEDGDTLSELAVEFGTTVDVLVALNNLANANDLRVGQELRLPGAPEEEVDEEPADEQADDDEAVTDVEEDDTAPDTGDAPDETPAEPDPVEPAVTGLSPEGIPQPGPDVTVEAIPQRPTDFDAYAVAVLPWLQDRSGVDEILPIFEDWGMPSVLQGDRLNLVDTDLDGLSSVVIVWTNPASQTPFPESNLAIYDPIPSQPDRYRLAYDHRLVRGETPGQIGVLQVVDMTGDGRRDVTFIEQTCGAHTCTASFHLLMRDGTGYRDAVLAPIDIPTAHSIDVVSDETGDGVPDISVTGGTFGSVGAEPQREFRWVFSGAGGNVQQVSRVGLENNWLVWALLDANEAFDAQDWARAVALYNVVLSGDDLDEFAPFAGEASELRAVANLRKSLALGISGDDVGASAAAQALTTGSGLVSELGGAYLAGLASGGVADGCASFNEALASRADEWDSFWSNYGYGVPQMTADELCPF